VADWLNARGGMQSDPYGVAQFDMSDLLLGRTALQLQSAIMNSRVAEPTRRPSIGVDGQLIPPPGVKEGPSESLLIISYRVVYCLREQINTHTIGSCDL